MNNLPKEKIKKKTNAYLKYSGIAFQMAFLVFAGMFLGKKLDEYLGLSTPLMTVLLILVFFGGYMYKLYVDLMKD